MKPFELAKSVAGLLACSIAAHPAMAYEDIDAEVDEGKGGGFVGLGIAYSTDYEGGDDYEATPAPFGAYHWASGRYIDLGGTGGSENAGRLTFNALTSDTAWEFGPILQYRLERDDVDNSKVDRMSDIDAAVEVGAFLGWQGDRLNLATNFAADVSDEHDGYLWYFEGKYRIPVSDSFTWSLGAHLTWASEDYMDTYFGVKSSDSARSGLSKYSADEGFKDVGMSLTGHYKFTDAWGLAANLSYTRMLNDAEDSPLVDDVGDKNQIGGVVAVTYSF